MSVDPEIPVRVYKAFRAEHPNEFRQLLTDHPEFLRNEDGTERWMWRAAQGGRLSFVQVLFDLGIGVNESQSPYEPENPYCQMEGAILQAAEEGHTEIVQWFLDRGAKINFVINGEARCVPLQHAASGGRLDVVKLLVEHGANIESSFLGSTPIGLAKEYGHTTIADYLTEELRKQKAKSSQEP